MPVEIKVGPPVLTINQGTQFMVTDERGEIKGASELQIALRTDFADMLRGSKSQARPSRQYPEPLARVAL
jgi:hypothetical protein